MLTASLAKFALAMHRNLNSDDSGPQVRDMTEKFDRTFAISIFHLTIGGAHSAEGLNAAFDTLGLASPLSRAQLPQRMLPYFFDS